MKRARWNEDVKCWTFFFITVSIFFSGCGQKSVETTVSGKVFSTNNQPIAHAGVFTKKSYVIADAEGNFELKENGGSPLVRAQAAGYESGLLKYRGKPLAFKLKPLKPGNADVLIRDSKGAPIRNASVVIFDSNSLAPIGLVQTSERGLVKLKNIPAGTLLLGIINKDFEPQLFSSPVRSHGREKLVATLLPAGTKPSVALQLPLPASGTATITKQVVIQLPYDPDVVQPGQSQSISYRSTNEWDFGGGTLGPDTVTTLGGIRSSAHAEGIFKIDTRTGNSSIGLGFDVTPFQDQSAQVPSPPKTPDSSPPYQGTTPQAAIAEAQPSFSYFIVRKTPDAQSGNIDVNITQTNENQAPTTEGTAQNITPISATPPATPLPPDTEIGYIQPSSPLSRITAAERKAIKEEAQAVREIKENLQKKILGYNDELRKLSKDRQETGKRYENEGRYKGMHYYDAQAKWHKDMAPFYAKYESLMSKLTQAQQALNELLSPEFIEGMLTETYYTDFARDMRKAGGITDDSVNGILTRSRAARSRASEFFSSN